MFFARRQLPAGAEAEDSVLTRAGASQLSGEGLEAEYDAVVRSQLGRLGVPLQAVQIEVSPAGTTPAGLTIYVAMARLVAWHPRTSLRLLVALPLLEARIRQALETSWLGDVSQFGGLWIHASAGVRGPEVLGEIRQAVQQLELGAKAVARDAPAKDDWSSSVQAVLQEPGRKP